MTKKILLAEDQEDYVRLMEATLGEDDRYMVLIARDGDEALDIARRELPDLVLLDILMPKKDGYEVCRNLKNDPETSNIRIVMITSLVRDSDRRKATKVGADYFFSKPFSPTALLAKVDEVLSLH